jgi:uncharacterized protein (DUF1778 family)
MQEGLSINYVNVGICRCTQSMHTTFDSHVFSLYYLNAYAGGVVVVPRLAVEDNSRMSLRIRAEEKALLMRAVALKHTDLTDFVLRHALLAAKAVIEEADHVQLSGRDSLRVLDLLENPPAPNAKLLAAARALPKRS